ncbi:MAG TPA: AAA family ATPase [Rhabdochlamydiaceae bacterium]|nr:AAA family ATPase [Rhabdochlamydiaceae bacterium]
MKGRWEEGRAVKRAWNVPPGEKFRFALLVGPAGSGKTEFVNGLAWESVNKPDSFVFGKKIFTVTTIDLVKEGTYYLNETLSNIKDKENTILFFDECHTAGGRKGLPGALIEFLKTALHAHNIRAIFATDKYEEYIAHDQAFVSRCNKIDFKELPKSESKKLLKSKVELDDRLIEVDANAYDALLSVASKNLEGCNPREMLNLYNDIRDHAYSWQPKQLSQELDKLILEKNEIEEQCQTENNDPTWSISENGKTLESKLNEKEKEILALNEKLKTQKSYMDRIDRLRKLGPQYRKKYNEVVHQAATTANEELQKEFLYLKYVLRPALQSALAGEAKGLEENYQEKLPLKIDADLIKKLYPDAFNSSKDPVKPENIQA